MQGGGHKSHNQPHHRERGDAGGGHTRNQPYQRDAPTMNVVGEGKVPGWSTVRNRPLVTWSEPVPANPKSSISPAFHSQPLTTHS